MSIRIDGTNTTANPGITGGDADTGLQFGTDEVSIVTGGTEQVKVDSSGRLLVGASSTSTCTAAFVGRSDSSTESPFIRFDRNLATPADGNALGTLAFGTTSDSNFKAGAKIDVFRDGGTWTANSSMPSRLVFSTTADGASSPTERMRITSDGEIIFGKTSTDNTATGMSWNSPTSTAAFLSITNTATASGSRVIQVNRQTSDGNLIDFRQANTLEGAISVSGTTVTYGGGHLARWSQLPSNADPSDILKGTVMSNLDEMCEWNDEENEQLNKTKISDVEGDPNVAGVFVSTSFTEEGEFDFYVGMTGDMVIRISQGITVQRGDLLMSAGDGTAKPQDDDIIRSKTIAKVTSTNVSCTYDDGSYCVPCVLMAC